MRLDLVSQEVPHRAAAVANSRGMLTESDSGILGDTASRLLSGTGAKASTPNARVGGPEQAAPIENRRIVRSGARRAKLRPRRLPVDRLAASI
jgi:hypothetical protein